MIKTFKELNKFSSVVSNLIKKNEGILDTKFGYALKRFEALNTEDVYDQYNMDMANLRIEHALTDKTTDAILRDPVPGGRGFQYDKSGMKLLMKAEKELNDTWNKKEIEVTPYICKPLNVPGLSPEEIEVFLGLIIEEQADDETL